MSTVSQLTALYGNFMLAPRAAPDVCRTCFNFTRGYEYCYACATAEAWLDLVVPISYSVAHEQLHHALATYKRDHGAASRRTRLALAAVVWRFLAEHERCVARAVGVERFAMVTTVPSGRRDHDEQHPLRVIVGELVAPTRARHQRLLRRSQLDVPARAFHAGKFEPLRSVHGEAVLLIDDTWTTGSNARSAAAALKAAGAGPVAAVVIGRHLNREWHENDGRLRGISRPFDWQRCALCSDREGRPATHSPPVSRGPPRTYR